MIDNEDGTEQMGSLDGGVAEPRRIVRRRNDDETPVSVTVIEALADARGVNPVDVERPLYDVVDPEALDRLFDRPGGDGIDGRVVFSFDAHEVTVTASGEVLVRSHEDPPSP